MCVCVRARVHIHGGKRQRDSCELVSFFCVFVCVHVHVCMSEFQCSSTQASHCSGGNPTSELSTTMIHLQPLSLCVCVCARAALCVSCVTLVGVTSCGVDVGEALCQTADNRPFTVDCI